MTHGRSGVTAASRVAAGPGTAVGSAWGLRSAAPRAMDQATRRRSATRTTAQVSPRLLSHSNRHAGIDMTTRCVIRRDFMTAECVVESRLN